MTTFDEISEPTTPVSTVVSEKVREVLDELVSARNWLVDKTAEARESARARLQTAYDELAARTESALSSAKSVAYEFAENVDAAMQARQEAAREGLGRVLR